MFVFTKVNSPRPATNIKGYVHVHSKQITNLLTPSDKRNVPSKK